MTKARSGFLVALGMTLFWLTRTYADTNVIIPPSGWSMAHDGQIMLLSRTYDKLTLNIHVSPWTTADGGDVETWLGSQKSRPSNGVKVISTNHTVKKSRIPNSYYVLRQLHDKDGQGRLSLLTACARKDGKVRTLDVFGPEPFFNRAIPDALSDSFEVMEFYCTGDGATQPSITSAPPDIPLEPIKFPAAPAGLKELRGYIYYGIQAGGLFGPTDSVIALFNNGTYTDDLAGTFNQGAGTSRQENPDSWGKWRISRGNLELKEPGKDSFETTRGDWLVNSGNHDQRLTGCYGKLTSSDGMGMGSVMVGSASSWCFFPNGRFTHSSTGFAMAFGNGVHGAAASTPPEQRGRYRIDLNAVHLVYDDGSDITAAFGFLSRDKTHIAINGRRFMAGDGHN